MTLLLFARTRVLLVLVVLCAIASSYPSNGPGAPNMVVKLDSRAFIDMSPVPCGLLSSDDVVSGRLSKRACLASQLTCPSQNFCCDPGASCCTNTFCCPKGYACPNSGPCYATDVVTVTFTSTVFVTSNAVSTVTTTSILLTTLTSISYTTTTTHIKSGISTSVVFSTVTTTQVMKRNAPAAPTPVMTNSHKVQVVAPKPSVEISLIEGQTPISDLLRRALGNVGLIEMRAITSYQTGFITSAIYSYSYITVRVVTSSTTNIVVQSTIVSTIIDSASSTITVTSTIIATVTSRSSSLASSGSTTSSSPTSSASATPSSPVIPDTDKELSQGAKIGIGVGASLAAVSTFILAGFCFWWRRRRRRAGSASNQDTMNQSVPVAGAGIAGVATKTEDEKYPMSATSSTAPTTIPSPKSTQKTFWTPQQPYQLPQQQYPPAQQAYELSGQTYPPYQQAHELPQQTYPSQVNYSEDDVEKLNKAKLIKKPNESNA